MWYWHDGPGGWGAFWMTFGMILVWLPLVLLIAWALLGDGRPWRGGRDHRDSGPREPDARELARRTYARGEIDRERYLQILEDLDRDDDARSARR